MTDTHSDDAGDPTELGPSPSQLPAGRLLPTTRYFPTDATMDRWLSLESFERTMHKILPSVFQVDNDGRIGTAFYIGDNEFLTAAHVVEDAHSIHLRNNKNTVLARIVGTDDPSDVAILHGDGTGLPAMLFGDERSVGPGARIAVVGYPLFRITGQPSITSGLLSAKWRDRDNDYIHYLQTDAAAYPGNSGCPVITPTGQVIGLIVENEPDYEGIIYAVTEATIQESMRRARQKASSPRPLLVGAQTSSERTVYVVQSVIGDSGNATARYSLSTNGGFQVRSALVKLREGRFNITAGFGSADGVKMHPLNTDGTACVATLAVADLPDGCTAGAYKLSADLTTSPERVIFEISIDCT